MLGRLGQSVIGRCLVIGVIGVIGVITGLVTGGVRVAGSVIIATIVGVAGVAGVATIIRCVLIVTGVGLRRIGTGHSQS